MDGDGQMDPDELYNICAPIVFEDIDYTKGNRLIHRSALLVIPKIRFVGNSMLSILTKIASGYWYVSDTQTGYTAISLKGLQSIEIDKIYPRYGYCNDVLVKLNMARCTIKEVEIKPVYDVGENSKMKIGKVIRKLSILLLKLFFVRIWTKYFINDMHPISLLYLFFSISFLITFFIGGWFFIDYFVKGLSISMNKLYFMIGMIVVSMQSLMFAMWLDIQDNKRLYKN